MRILDGYACAGAGAAGYAAAGLQPYGVELDPNRAKHYPFPVHIGDVLDVLDILNSGGTVGFTHPDGHIESLGLWDFIAAHMSPPCQAYTRGNAVRRDTQTKWPRLIQPTRARLIQTGLPYIIENVKDASIELVDPTRLCGCMFDLSTIDDDGIRIHLQRIRLFETSFAMTAPRPCDHSAHEWVAGVYGGARRDKYEAKYVRKGGYVPPNKAVAAALLGVTHPMTWKELEEAIPPAYTQHIGTQLMQVLR